jgi:hypothetical protein
MNNNKEQKQAQHDLHRYNERCVGQVKGMVRKSVVPSLALAWASSATR